MIVRISHSIPNLPLTVPIGVGDGGQGGGTCPLKFRKNIFQAMYYVKFGHFSGKNHVKFGHFVNFYSSRATFLT